ncbi:hypothetical protein [Kitasatospora cathayae]|uniref:Uncharacterized protein n=1 Tax=Kitasatospora cathayae TaxID=3004092 RepID=A0ABY7QDM7_9ACTN|nr:hypothetical protein [Kitasatospora sp. HUAS 3-15]WBP90339.1 hypothetical protein O1G21_33750 [Kitasatospora sp. HUAS 3-15]
MRIPRLIAAGALAGSLLLLTAPAHAAAAQTTAVTAYGYNDNDDGNGNSGTARISYPQIHTQATEGSGSYDDPATFATDPNEYPPGTIIYVPHLQKYFIMEDGCVECTADWQNGVHHVDLWMGPAAPQPEPALADCEKYVTRSSADILVSPDPGLPVDTTPMFADGQCTAVIH